MAQPDFATSDWVGKLTVLLNDLFQYEIFFEEQLARVQWWVEEQLGLPSYARKDMKINVRTRVDRYPAPLRGQPRQDSAYEKGVYERLQKILDVLREHPSLENAIYFKDGGLVLNLDLNNSRVEEQPIGLLLRNLIDYAVEQGPPKAAEALARVIQDGENRSLTSYSMMLFTGLHVPQKHKVDADLTLLPWEEVRQYMPDREIRLDLEAEDRIGRDPIAAIVSATKWGPVFAPATGFERDWPDSSPLFRDDAVLFIDLLAVAHNCPVRGSGRIRHEVGLEVERVVGRSHSFGFSCFLAGGYPSVKVAETPAMSRVKFYEAVRLFSKIRNESSRLSPAVSRLASSLSRSGSHGVLDSIIDVAIALELMYQPQAGETTYRLTTRAAFFLGVNAKERNEIGQNMKAFYDVRSAIMHGRPPAKREVFQKGFAIALRTLTKLALEGGPSRTEDWDKLVIAG